MLCHWGYFKGGALNTDGGLMLLRQADRKIGLRSSSLRRGCVRSDPMSGSSSGAIPDPVRFALPLARSLPHRRARLGVSMTDSECVPDMLMLRG